MFLGSFCEEAFKRFSRNLSKKFLFFQIQNFSQTFLTSFSFQQNVLKSLHFKNHFAADFQQFPSQTHQHPSAKDSSADRIARWS